MTATESSELPEKRKPDAPIESTGREISERPPKKTSLLQRVKEGLQTNKDLFIAGEIRNLTSSPLEAWFERVSIIVAPVNPLYEAEKLNEFMDNLLPDLKRSARDDFHQYTEESNMSIGRLYFDETIGVEKQEIRSVLTTDEPELFKETGISIGESHRKKERQFRRRTWVRVYPDPVSAQTIYEYEKGVQEGIIKKDKTHDFLAHWATPEQIKRLKDSNRPGRRIRGFLGKGR